MAAPRKTTPTSSAPLSEEVDLDLDTLEVPQATRPFAAKIRGRRIEFADPQNLDWQTLAQIDHPILFLKYCVNAEDREFIREQAGISGREFNALMTAYQEHYNVKKDDNGVLRQLR